jgi:hypothetical protein
MKHYIRVSAIKAEPLTLGEYNIRRGWTIPENEDPATEGYYVEYEDGYKSWCPKDKFEVAAVEVIESDWLELQRKTLEGLRPEVAV